MLQEPDLEPVLVGRTSGGRLRAGSSFNPLDGDPSQYVVRIEEGGFDILFMTYGEKSLYTRFFADFLRAQAPDVVHLHHTLWVGCELVSLVRRVLPGTAIVYTLHDYMPICNRDGRLVRTDESLCLEASPRRCHECFPGSSEQAFFLRQRFIQAHLRGVDLFLAPSNFLLERYVDWGIPRAQIRFEECARAPALPAAQGRTEGSEPRAGRPPNRPPDRLGFFADATPDDFEGSEVLLRAMRMVRERAPDAHLALHLSNVERYPEERRAQFWSLLGEAGNVTFGGGWDRAALPEIMGKLDWVVVPSRWWEGSALGIHDAFLYGRPVICSGIGAMAEKVAHEVNGLHFEVANPQSLADVICRAIADPALHERLRQGIAPVHGMNEHVAALTGIYRELLEHAGRDKTTAPVS
jgi:glycosyltransferase involved in cell wall biosynthesis